jgi:hypothetical protein
LIKGVERSRGAATAVAAVLFKKGESGSVCNTLAGAVLDEVASLTSVDLLPKQPRGMNAARGRREREERKRERVTKRPNSGKVAQWKKWRENLLRIVFQLGVGSNVCLS